MDTTFLNCSPWPIDAEVDDALVRTEVQPLPSQHTSPRFKVSFCGLAYLMQCHRWLWNPPSGSLESSRVLAAIDRRPFLFHGII